MDIKANNMNRPVKKITKNIYVYYAVMMTSGLINSIKNLIYSHILKPEAFGYYSLAILLSSLGIYFCSFGLYEGAMSVFPVLYGKDEKKAIDDFRNRGGTWILVFASSLIVAVWLLSICFPFKNQSVGRIFLLGAFFAATQAFFVFALADMRCRMMTTQFGFIMFVRSILSLIFGVLISRAFGYAGILISEALIPLVLTVLMIRYRLFNFALHFSRFFALKPLFHVGFPLMINGLVTTLASNLDRFFIVTAFGTLFFGQYSFAMLLITAASLLQAIIYQHIGPSILFRIGKGQNPHLILKRLNRIVMVVSMSLVVIWFPFKILTKFIIERYFQDYVSAIPLLYILFFGGGLIMISHYEHFVVAIRKTEYLLAINVLIITAISLLFIVGLLLHLPISWFATFFVLGRLLYFLSTNVLAKRAVAKL